MVKFWQKKKRIFNYRLSRARRYVESSFGILSNKWQVFHKAINVNVDFAKNIIKTCCILHNFVRSRDGYNLQDALSVQGLIDARNSNSGSSRAPIQIRNTLADYFVSDAGSVPWQQHFI